MPNPRLLGFDKNARLMLLWTWLTATFMHFGLGWHQVQAP